VKTEVGTRRVEQVSRVVSLLTYPSGLVEDYRQNFESLYPLISSDSRLICLEIFILQSTKKKHIGSFIYVAHIFGAFCRLQYVTELG